MKIVKACILFAAVSALWFSSAQGQCPQGWDVSNGWRIVQGPTNVDLDLRQKGTVITGKARYEGIVKEQEGGLSGAFGEEGTIRGTVDGTIVGDQIKMHIYWDVKHTTGVYNGTIRASGRIEGTVYGQENPARKVDWHSDTTMPCAGSGPASPTPTPKPAAPPIPHTPGPRNTELDPNNPIQKLMLDKMAAQRAQAAAKGAPTIIASQVSIPAGKSEGTATLTWDGGPDHPYAEIWVKVDDQDEKKVVEQGKGERKVPVRPGKTYVYILTDSGQTLSTVTVKIQ